MLVQLLQCLSITLVLLQLLKLAQPASLQFFLGGSACGELIWAWDGLNGMLTVCFHTEICNLYFNVTPLAGFFSFACKCLICTWNSPYSCARKIKTGFLFALGTTDLQESTDFTASFSRCAVPEWGLFTPFVQYSSKSHARYREDSVLAES